MIDARYRITGLLGRGGMGSVYRAEHLTIKKPVAIKLLHPDVGKIPEFAKRFEREAFASAQATHDNSVQISDFGTLDDGRLYLVMEYLDGKPLSEVLDKEGRIAADRVLRIGAHVLRALAHAHGQGVVHRDVKPENIFLVDKDGDKDFAKLLDFGLAKLVGDAQAGQENLTRAGFAIGTPTYMAPEWFTEHDIDGRADLYSLSITLFEMLAGRPPFSSERKEEVLKMHISKPPPRIREVAPDVDVPRPLEDLIHRGLAKDPNKRIASASEYLAALEALRAGRTPAAAPERDGKETTVFHGAPRKSVDEAWGSTPRPIAVAKVPNPAAPNKAPLPRPFRGARDANAVAAAAASVPPPGGGTNMAERDNQDNLGAGQTEKVPEAPMPGVEIPRANWRHHPVVQRVRGWSREKQFGAAVGVVVALILLIALVTGGDEPAGASASADRPSSAMPRDSTIEAGEAETAADLPADTGAVLKAWKAAGLEPGGFAEVEGAALPEGRCQAGAVSGVSVTLCQFPSNAQATKARAAGLRRVGETTGAAIVSGRQLLVVADRNAVDPRGKRMNQIIKTFQQAGGSAP